MNCHTRTALLREKRLQVLASNKDLADSQLLLEAAAIVIPRATNFPMDGVEQLDFDVALGS